MIATWKSAYIDTLGGSQWYLASGSYKPGFVNSVSIVYNGGSFVVNYTDGYSTQTKGFFKTFEEAELMAIDVFTGEVDSYFKACCTRDELEVIRPMTFGASRLREMYLREARFEREYRLSI